MLKWPVMSIQDKHISDAQQRLSLWIAEAPHIYNFKFWTWDLPAK